MLPRESALTDQSISGYCLLLWSRLELCPTLAAILLQIAHHCHAIDESLASPDLNRSESRRPRTPAIITGSLPFGTVHVFSYTKSILLPFVTQGSDAGAGWLAVMVPNTLARPDETMQVIMQVKDAIRAWTRPQVFESLSTLDKHL